MVKGEGDLEEIEFSSSLCESIFRDRIAKLLPLENSNKRFEAENYSLIAHKLTAVNLVQFENRFELFLAINPRPGYAFLDHLMIGNENGIKYDINRVFNGLYFQTIDEVRYLIVDNIENRVDSAQSPEEEVAGVLDMLKRYRFKAIFSRWNPEGLYTSKWLIGDAYYLSNYDSVIDKFIFDEWSQNVAIELGWTNTEMLRFRLCGEVPPKKG